MATELEDFVATVEHRRPERILYHAGFVEDLHQRVVEHIGTADIAGHYGFFSPAGIGPERPADLPPLDFSRYWENEDLPEGTTINGAGVAMVPSGFYHFWGYISPLRNAASLKEIEDYPLEDLGKWDFSKMVETAEDAHARGRVVCTWVGHMYETSWQIRGYEEFLIDTIERPAWAECLLERICRQNTLQAVAATKAGADVLHCGDDVASQESLMFSKKSWAKLIHSRWARVWAEVKSINPQIKIFYHSDGNVFNIVGDLVEAGLDILNPLQPECLDLEAIRRTYGDRLSFDGTIGTQSTMPWGTPAEVRARVKEVIEKYGKNGGLIISPTHVLEPEVSIENIEAMVDACREYGAFT